MNVKHILSHVDLLSSLGTRVYTDLLFEPGKADCCEINGSSFLSHKKRMFLSRVEY